MKRFLQDPKTRRPLYSNEKHDNNLGMYLETHYLIHKNTNYKEHN